MISKQKNMHIGQRCPTRVRWTHTWPWNPRCDLGLELRGALFPRCTCLPEFTQMSWIKQVVWVTHDTNVWAMERQTLEQTEIRAKTLFMSPNPKSSGDIKRTAKPKDTNVYVVYVYKMYVTKLSHTAFTTNVCVDLYFTFFAKVTQTWPTL